jgi:SAM-dependent methyltransferase
MKLPEIDARAQKYIDDMKWVQQDIWKLSTQYPNYEKNYCEVFSKHIIAAKYSEEDRFTLKESTRKLQLIMQGPFWLGDDVVVGGFWNKRDTARQTLGRVFSEEDALKGKRVLEIGSMSGYDSFYLNLKKPEYYLSIEPSGFHYQALFLNSIYKTEIDFKQLFWQDVSTELNGTFDVVLNCGCLYHEADFISMIKKTTDLLKVGGKTIVATVSIKDEKYAEYIKYMPDIYAGDMTYWFAIGEKALFRIFESYGCEGMLVLKPGLAGDSGNGKTVEGHSAENYNFYEFTKVANRSRPLMTIPRY